MSLSNDHLVWIDLEMTGLDPQKERIIEIATVITDSNLNVVSEGPELVIHQSNELLDQMNSWNKEHHGQSGLLQRVKDSQIDEQTAARRTLEFIRQWVPAKKSPLCGNSVHVDRSFLCRYMPELEQHFHYRNLDVSTIKILAQHWAPTVAAGISKVSAHTALKDIHDSIEELRYYRHHLFDLANL